MSTLIHFEKTKEKAEILYKNIGSIFCPYFKEKIVFNEKGLHHIKFKNERTARERKDQYVRLRNIHLAPVVLMSSYTLQEKQIRNEFIEIHTNTRREKSLKQITYYAFVAIITEGDFEKRVKIIVKQVSGGIKIFWSIIPYWKNNKEFKIHTGDLLTD